MFAPPADQSEEDHEVCVANAQLYLMDILMAFELRAQSSITQICGYIFNLTVFPFNSSRSSSTPIQSPEEICGTAEIPLSTGNTSSQQAVPLFYLLVRSFTFWPSYSEEVLRF